MSPGIKNETSLHLPRLEMFVPDKQTCDLPSAKARSSKRSRKQDSDPIRSSEESKKEPKSPSVKSPQSPDVERKVRKIIEPSRFITSGAVGEQPEKVK
jgi:hypothetical protein